MTLHKQDDLKIYPPSQTYPYYMSNIPSFFRHMCKSSIMASYLLISVSELPQLQVLTFFSFDMLLSRLVPAHFCTPCFLTISLHPDKLALTPQLVSMSHNFSSIPFLAFLASHKPKADQSFNCVIANSTLCKFNLKRC